MTKMQTKLEFQYSRISHFMNLQPSKKTNLNYQTISGSIFSVISTLIKCRSWAPPFSPGMNRVNGKIGKMLVTILHLFYFGGFGNLSETQWMFIKYQLKMAFFASEGRLVIFVFSSNVQSFWRLFSSKYLCKILEYFIWDILRHHNSLK